MAIASNLLTGAAGGAAVSILIRAHDKFSATFDKARRDSDKLSISLAAVGKVAVIAGGVAAVALGKFAIEAANAGDVQEQFNQVLGIEGPAVLKKLQNATLGTVDKYRLMTAASIQVTKGVRADVLPVMAEYAQRLKDMGKAGGDVAEIMESMGTAIATGRQITLNTLGITVDAAKVYDDYAASIGKSASSLSTFEKQTAFQNEAVKEMTRLMENMATPTLDAADKVAQLNARWTELKVSIGEKVAPVLSGLIDIVFDVGQMFKNMGNEMFFLASTLPEDELRSLVSTTADLSSKTEELAVSNMGLVDTARAIINVEELKNEVDISTAAGLEKYISLNDRLNGLLENQPPILQEIIDKLKEVDAVSKKISDEQALSNILSAFPGGVQTGAFGKKTSVFRGAGGTPFIVGAGGTKITSSGVSSFGDFIMRPGQQPISFSPSDTIIGTKNGGAGGNVTINISSNAVGAEEVFRLLMREMKSQGVRI